jgi:hypothetical protein
MVDVDTGYYLGFLYHPNDITGEMSTVYAATTIPRISHPPHPYVAGELRKIGLKLFFFKGSVKESVDWPRSGPRPDKCNRSPAPALPGAGSPGPPATKSQAAETGAQAVSRSSSRESPRPKIVLVISPFSCMTYHLWGEHHMIIISIRFLSDLKAERR